jgi:hypothetical protein
MTVTEKFKNDSARAAIRALRGLEPTAIMLETWSPDIFPEINDQGQKHFGRIMMEAAASAIRYSWSQAIKDCENSDLADEVADLAALMKAVRSLLNGIDTGLVTVGTVADETLANTMRDLRAAAAKLAWTQDDERGDRSALPQAQEQF